MTPSIRRMSEIFVHRVCRQCRTKSSDRDKKTTERAVFPQLFSVVNEPIHSPVHISVFVPQKTTGVRFWGKMSCVVFGFTPWFAVVRLSAVSKVLEHLFEKYLDNGRSMRYHVDIPKKRRACDETRQTDRGCAAAKPGCFASGHRHTQCAVGVPSVRRAYAVHPQAGGR